MNKNDELKAKPNKAETIEDNKVVITDDELEGVTGGRTRTTQTSRPTCTGFACPVCEQFIPVSMYQIMTSSIVYCPCCTTAFDIKKESTSHLPDIDSLKRN
ncbi:MAG: hypothetical protein Q4E51_09705 [Lachnospiraceae bacterium]|nr:hypothetical protein [Lachnospiraceae bacterium]MDO4966965.1 hypothetical protein [Lachnospiraceae bacterium]